MKNTFKHFAVILLVAFFILPHTVQAKEYTIPTIRVEVSVNSDGTVRITEYRTYVFDGDFSWADYRLPLEGFSHIRDVSVSEGNRKFINKNTEESGTFLVATNDDEVQIKWFYDAEDEQRTFAISYTLESAIVMGPEWSEFFWNYLSASREMDTDSLHIELSLPRAVGGDSLHTWKRGVRSKINLQNNTGGYTLAATNVDDDESVKVRMVFPRAIFNQNDVSTNDDSFTLQQAQVDEEAYRKEQVKRQKRNARLEAYGKKLAVVVSLLSILAFIFIYRKYGKRHSAAPVSSMPSTLIPGRLKPAVAGWLLNGRSIGSTQLTATLLDLSRRKYFILKEQEPDEKWVGKDEKVFTIEHTDDQPGDRLTDWEESLVEFISEQINEGNTRIDELFSESSYSASKWFSKWKKELNAFCEAKDWYDARSYKGVYTNIGVQLLLAALAILSVFWVGPLGVVPIGITAILFIASFAIIRRTPEGEKMHKKWNAYKEGLKNAEEHTVENNLLDKHFIYATSFGLSKDNIETIFAQCNTTDIAFYWVVLYSGSVNSTADIAGSFSALSATGTASFPGASAAGAGATGATAGAAGGGAAGGAG